MSYILSGFENGMLMMMAEMEAAGVLNAGTTRNRQNTDNSWPSKCCFTLHTHQTASHVVHLLLHPFPCPRPALFCHCNHNAHHDWEHAGLVDSVFYWLET